MRPLPIRHPVPSHPLSRFAACLWATAAIGLTTQVSGCQSDEAELCELVCDCNGCSTSEAEDCADDLEDLREDAEGDGCDAEYDDFTSCAVDKFDCDDEVADLGRCDDEVEDLFECLDDPPTIAFVDPCNRAAEICGGPGGEPAQCTGAALCASKCILGANSCDFTNAALADCVSACAGSTDGSGPTPPGSDESGSSGP
jgi:hypothetical protein